MAQRKIREIAVGKCAVRVYRDPEWDQYIVKSIVGGKVVGGKEGGYFTDDKEDAFGTAEAEAAALRRRPACGGGLGRRRRRR